MNTNRRVILWERPRYVVPTAKCFRMESASVPIPGEGEVRIRTTWLGIDTLLYSRVQRVSTQQSDPIRLKEVMFGPAVGRIDESRHPEFKPGELVSGLWGWEDFAISKGEGLRKLDIGIQKSSYVLGAYGISGFGAYIALDRLSAARAGETVVVGAALGGFGQIAGQIAKLKGCRVVGLSSTNEKCLLAMSRLGLDACVNRQSKDFPQLLAEACPRGIDIYIEIAAGRSLEAVMPLLNLNARIVAGGTMDTPHFGEPPFKGRFQSTTSFMFEVINRRVSIRGLVAHDYIRECYKEFEGIMKVWIDSGVVRPLEAEVDGLENAPDALQNIFEGLNLGKCIVKVAD